MHVTVKQNDIMTVIPIFIPFHLHSVRFVMQSLLDKGRDKGERLSTTYQR